MLRLIAALLLLALPAKAVDFATVSPGTATIDGRSSTILTLRWTVGVSGPAGTVTVTSPYGTLDNGNTSQTVGGPLRRTVRLTGTSATVVITERVRIDLGTARRILDEGAGSFSREFNDGTAMSATATVDLAASNRPTTDLSFREFSLSFDDRTLYRVVRPGAALTGVLSVTSAGRGNFQGSWEVSGPNGGGFRPVGRVSRFLIGSRAATFQSPQLPTRRPGTYRLRFSAGDGASNSPAITYVVAPDGSTGAIGLNSPAPGTTLTGATEFRWTGMQGAARYRIEFLLPGSTRPIAAAEVPGTAARLRPFTLARLNGRGEIAWRITAYDAAGNPVARSQERVLNAGGTFLRGSP